MGCESQNALNAHIRAQRQSDEQAGLLERTEEWIAHLSDQMKAATALRDLLKDQPEIEEIITKAQKLLR